MQILAHFDWLGDSKLQLLEHDSHHHKQFFYHEVKGKKSAPSGR